MHFVHSICPYLFHNSKVPGVVGPPVLPEVVRQERGRYPRLRLQRHLVDGDALLPHVLRVADLPHRPLNDLDVGELIRVQGEDRVDSVRRRCERVQVGRGVADPHHCDGVAVRRRPHEDALVVHAHDLAADHASPVHGDLYEAVQEAGVKVLQLGICGLGAYSSMRIDR